jgi:hypothetical protein
VHVSDFLVEQIDNLSSLELPSEEAFESSESKSDDSSPVWRLSEVGVLDFSFGEFGGMEI